MNAIEHYRAKASEYRELLDNSLSPQEAEICLGLEQAYTALARDEQWTALNCEPAMAYDIVPTSDFDRNKQYPFVIAGDHVLRCLDAAEMMRLNGQIVGFVHGRNDKQLQ